MSKRVIHYLIFIGVFIFIFYKAYKRHEATIAEADVAIPVLHNVAVRAINGTDPIRIEDLTSIQFISKVYEGLYSYHPLKRPFEIMPNLADGMPSISPDGKVYTLKIKQGVLFQDDACFPNKKGRELKASDFVFSFKRIVDPNHVVPYVGLIEGKIKGLDAWKQQAVIDYTQEVEGLKVLDDHTLQITLVAPWSGFLNFLAMPPAFVVAPEAVHYYGIEFVNHPVGTGPFMLLGGFDPQAKKLEFVKNPTFRKKYFPSEPSEVASCYHPMLVDYAGKPLPLVDKVVTHILTEEQPRWLKMEKAEIDVDRVEETAFALKFVKEGKVVPSLAPKGLVLFQAPAAGTEFFAFNNSHPLFTNRYLRQAMSMAFDRVAYNKTFYHDAAEVAQSLIPSVLMEDVLYSAYKDTLQNPYAYNLEQAKAYLVKAGFPGGKGLPVITLDTRSETTFKDKANFFAQCMAKVGITVKVISNIWSELHNKVTKQATMMHAYTWIADDPDPLAFLQVIRTKSLVGLQYEDFEFNKLFDQAEITIEKKKRAEIFIKLNKMVVEAVPMICAVHMPVQFLHQKWVKNVFYNAIDRSLDQYIAVNMAEKAKATTR